MTWYPCARKRRFANSAAEGRSTNFTPEAGFGDPGATPWFLAADDVRQAPARAADEVIARLGYRLLAQRQMTNDRDHWPRHRVTYVD